jgi:hypothetical protein
MTKSEEIRALLAEGRESWEIAQIVGCNTAYVRVVRQRDASPDGMTPSDRKWRAENHDKVLEGMARRNRERYASDPKYREMQREKGRARRQKMIEADPNFRQKERERARANWRAKKAEISARRKLWRDERRAIVAAMVEVANAKA